MRDVTNGGFPETLAKSYQRLQSPRISIPHSTLFQGSDPHRIRALVGTSTTVLSRARVQVRVSGD